MISIVHSIMLSYGWKRALIAFAAGGVGALALPPFNFFPAMIVPMATAVWLLDGAASLSRKQVGDGRMALPSIRSALAIGWCLGFGYFVAGLWWLGAAFLVEADQFAWALPLGVAGLPAVLACFTALGMAGAHLLWTQSSARIVALALCLSISEWLRGILFTGFPWNDFGMSLAGHLVLAQTASIVGLHGMTLLAVLIFASPATLADDRAAGRTLKHRAFLAGLGLLAFVTVFGALRLSGGEVGSVAGVKLRIMQPNLPQNAEFRLENKEAILDRYLALSDRATSPGTSGLADVTHLIWPESAFPFILARDAWALSRIGEALGSGTVLITGAARAQAVESDTLPGESRVSYFNAIQVVGEGGVIVDSYDKIHLVPFGEYLPLSDLLDAFGVRQFVHIPGGFQPGALPKLLNVPGLPGVLPLICYEAIFPAAVPSDLAEKAGVILNVTNDAWFGTTPGPYQHLAQARLRSIEEGIPLVRAANTGISAIIDSYGRILSSLPLGTEGVVDGALPERIQKTYFTLSPIGIPVLLHALTFILFVFLRRQG